jgi:regulation of enolase protein 1 (concanavalin A-like superfamily)
VLHTRFSAWNYDACAAKPGYLEIAVERTHVIRYQYRPPRLCLPKKSPVYFSAGSCLRLLDVTESIMQLAPVSLADTDTGVILCSPPQHMFEIKMTRTDEGVLLPARAWLVYGGDGTLYRPMPLDCRPYCMA